MAQREFRSAARKPMTYYSRLIAAIIAASVSLSVMFADFSGTISNGSSGEQVFYILSALGYCYVCLEGAFLACDCLSLEKREGTLGLLFLTPLKSYDVIAGKLMSFVGRLFYCLTAAFPAMAITFVLGGVSGADFVRMLIALTNALFFSAALGMLVSACVWHERHAIGLALAAILFFAGGFPCLGLINGGPINQIPTPFLIPTPAGAFLIALGPAIPTPPSEIFSESIYTTQAMAWLFLALSCLILPRSLRVRAANIDRRRIVKQIHSSEYLPLLRNSFTGKFTWWPALALSAAAACILVTGMNVNPYGELQPALIIITGIAVHLTLKFVVTQRACRALIDQRKSGELELLLTTPFDQDDIRKGFLLGLKQQTAPSLIVVLLFDIFLIWVGLNKFETNMLWVTGCVLEILWLLVNLYTLTWVGLYQGIKCRSAVMAIQRTLFCIIFLPWIALAALITLAGVVSLGSWMTPEMLLPGAAVFFLFLVLCNLGFTGWAMCQLADRFRVLAAQQLLPATPRPRWDSRRWFRIFFLIEKEEPDRKQTSAILSGQ